MTALSTPSKLRGKRVLLTGAAGFVGRHMIQELLRHGYEVISLDAVPADAPGAAVLPAYHQVDLREHDAVHALMADVKPDAVIHLAAISFVPDGNRDPQLLLGVNIGGTIHLTNAVRAECPEARILFVSSAQVYGTATAATAEFPLREDSPLLPLSPYAVSKVAGERFLQACAATYGLQVVIARPGNHIGPGQATKFVATSFAKQVLDAKYGRITEMKVGNLDSIRDFSDVRDIVRAYRLLLERGRSGFAYNITTDNHVRIGDLLQLLKKIIGVEIKTTVDPALYRPTDVLQSIDTSRLYSDTGWIPVYSLEQTLHDIVASLEETAAT